jgi:hypothetical protein
MSNTAGLHAARLSHRLKDHTSSAAVGASATENCMPAGAPRVSFEHARTLYLNCDQANTANKRTRG